MDGRSSNCWQQLAPQQVQLPAQYTTTVMHVPEFGPVASIVLAIAVLSMVVFAAKTRVIPKF